MAYKKKEVLVQTKFTRVYEDEDTKSVWTYDLSKTTSGPVSVETTYKNLPTVTKKKKATKKASKAKKTPVSKASKSKPCKQKNNYCSRKCSGAGNNRNSKL